MFHRHSLFLDASFFATESSSNSRTAADEKGNKKRPPAMVPNDDESSYEEQLLPFGFVPGPNDVICARGAAAKRHVGNRQYKETLRILLPLYDAASTKLDKTFVVNSVLERIRGAGGVFCRKVDNSVQWAVVDVAMIREKVGQNMRDLLHSKYKSSAKSKKARRQQQQKKQTESVGRTPVTSSTSTFVSEPREVPNQANVANSCNCSTVSDLHSTESPNQGRHRHKRSVWQVSLEDMVLDISSGTMVDDDLEPLALNDAAPSPAEELRLLHSLLMFEPDIAAVTAVAETEVVRSSSASPPPPALRTTSMETTISFNNDPFMNFMVELVDV